MSDNELNNYKKILQDLEIHKEELVVQNEELKEKEESLNEAYEDYFMLFNESPIAYLIINNNFQIIKYNTKANITFMGDLDNEHKRFLLKYFDTRTLLALKDWLSNEDERETEYFICDLLVQNKLTKFKIYSSPYKSEKTLIYLLLLIFKMNMT